jgi:hypothetical protein
LQQLGGAGRVPLRPRARLSCAARTIFASRSALESGASSVGLVHLDVGTVPTEDANLPFSGPLQPSTAVDPGSGTEPRRNVVITARLSRSAGQ